MLQSLARPLLCVLILTGGAWVGQAQQPGSAEAIARKLADPNRPQADKQRDADRKPAEILAAVGIKPGMTVAELMAGTGYYTEILSHAVGPEGGVYAQNNSFVIDRFVGDRLRKRVESSGLENVQILTAELEEPGLPKAELDAVFMVLFYHDTYWFGTDRAKMNRAILEALKPGGQFIVIDHHAEAGSGDRDVQSLHRVDAAIVKQELLDAGFEWVAELDLLAHPEDDRTQNVFRPTIRGKTDRFVYQLRKPASP